MSKSKNTIWSFFASVKLALFVLFILAIASVIGTVIPQNSPAEEYVRIYGPQTARLFEILDIPDMYNSWWFTSLLALLCLNLIVCTIERLPNVWRIMVRDNLQTDVGRLAKMNPRREMTTGESPEDAAARARESLSAKGWKATEARKEEGILLFAQKGPWTRLGVYTVHASILIIFIGAIIGSYFGYKGSVMIPETTKTDTIYAFGTRTPIKLGFEVLCEKFLLSHYPNGAPKEFISDLVVFEDGKKVLSKTIEVNDPLTYKGHTFYQSSYQSYQKFLVTLTNNSTNKRERFLVEPGKQVTWPGENVSFGVLSRKMTEIPGEFEYKVWFSPGGKGTPRTFWLEDDGTVPIQQGDSDYTYSMKEFFATGLQVTKDPGVWYVYIGCTIMLIGLYVAFFMSHRRIWVYISRKNEQTSVLVSGTSNKNKLGFEKNLEAVSQSLEEKLKTNP